MRKKEKAPSYPVGDGAVRCVSECMQKTLSVFRAHFKCHIESDACLLEPRLIDPSFSL
jgi:hypothetical protein